MKKKSTSQSAAIAIATIVVVYSILVVTLLHFEKNTPESKIHSLFDATWYLAETLTTVGYGDMLPVSPTGRLIGFLFLLSSVGVYGFIIGQMATFVSAFKEKKMLGLNGTNFTNHIVIIGWNEFGQSVVSHLLAAGRQVAVVTKDRSAIDIIHEYYSTDKVFTLYSDYNNFDLLEKVNIQEASIVFINLNDDTEKLVYIINIKKRYAELNYVVTLDNGNLKATFINAGITYAISKNEISSKLLASYIYEPDVAFFTEELIAYAHENHEYDMKQVIVQPDNPFSNVPYEKAFFDLKRSCNVVLLGIVKMVNGKRVLMKNPSEQIFINPGDYLVVLLDGSGADRIKQFFHLQEGI
jgi:voltage-gated potassium channel